MFCSFFSQIVFDGLQVAFGLGGERLFFLCQISVGLISIELAWLILGIAHTL